MHAGAQASPVGWLSTLLAVLVHAGDTRTERSAASSVLDARPFSGLDVEACAAARDLLACRRMRGRGRLLLEPAVELVALRRTRPRVFLELLRRLPFARPVEERVDVRGWRVRRGGVRSGLAGELVGGNHHRGREILRGSRVEVCCWDAVASCWRRRAMRRLGGALLLTPLRGAGRTVDDGALLVVG